MPQSITIETIDAVRDHGVVQVLDARRSQHTIDGELRHGGVRAVFRDEQDRHVGPWGLPLQRCSDVWHCAGCSDFLGKDDGCEAAREVQIGVAQIRSDLAWNIDLGEYGSAQRRIGTRRP